MRPLVAVRRAAPFDPQFLLRSPLFWPLSRAARALGPTGDFPRTEDLVNVFEVTPPVRFVEAPPEKRDGESLQRFGRSRGRVVQDCRRINPSAEPESKWNVGEQVLAYGGLQ